MCLDHGLPMEDGDHSNCSIELLECPEHRCGQADTTEPHVEDHWQRIQVPDNLDEMFEHWQNDPEPNIGWCLMCDSPIRSEADLIPGTSSHNCSQGLALDAKARAQDQE